MNRGLAWPRRKLTELGFVGRGKSRHRPRDDASLYGGKYPFFQTGDVKAANLYLTEYTQTYNDKGLSQSKLWQPGTLCITIAANIADTAILGVAGCFPDSVVGFVPTPDQADAVFVKYSIDNIKQQMQSVSRGTTQDNLSLDKLLTFDLPTPPVHVQRKIVGILQAYDDLIENNLRRIRTLELMARTLYREWFVNFRFPDHESSVVHEGGRPSGWRDANIAAATRFISRGISPTYDDSGPSLVINQKCIRDQRLSLAPARRQCKPIPPEKLVQAGDVLINSTGVGTLGRVCQAWGDLVATTVDSHVTIVRPAPDVDPCWFGITLLLYEPDFERMGVGATGQTELSRTSIGSKELTLPPVNLQHRFGEIVLPMQKYIEQLGKKNDILSRSRDLLLPRLLSGQINLEDVEPAA